MVMQSLEYNVRELNQGYKETSSLIEQAKGYVTQGEQERAMSSYMRAYWVANSVRRFQRGVNYHRERISLDAVDASRLAELNIDKVLGLDFERLISQIENGLDDLPEGKTKRLEQLGCIQIAQSIDTELRESLLRSGGDPYAAIPSLDEVRGRIDKALGPNVSLSDAVIADRDRW